MIKKAQILLFSFLAISYSIYAQQPSYYIIGEMELSGINVYSIIQDNDANVWLSTDNGLFRYDGYDFHLYENSIMKSQSLFGLCSDNNGMIYCCNLYGQIFRIKNDSLQFYYQIPDSLLSNMLHINFDNLNRLTFSSKSYYVLNDKLEPVFLLELPTTPRSIQKNSDDELLLFNFKKTRIDYFKNDELFIKSKSDLSSINGIKTDPREFSVRNSTELLVSIRKPVIFNYLNKKWNKIQFEDHKKLDDGTNIYLFSDSTLWLVNEKNGAYVYNINGKSLYGGVKLFPRHRLSGYMEDREGNLWFPTLGKGIIIVPNKDIIDFGNHPLLKKDDIKAISSDVNGNIYVAGLNGLVYKIKNQQIKVINDYNSIIEHLTYIDYDNSLLFNSKRISSGKKNAIIANYQTPGAKDIVGVDKFNYLAATRSGVQLYSFNELDKSFQDKLGKFKDAIVQDGKFYIFHLGRTSCIGYDPNKNEIWAGTTTGLKIIKKEGIESILLHEQQIVATDIELINGQIWVSTLKNGVLVFQDEKLIFNITSDEGLLSNEVIQMKYKNSKLFFATKSGFQVYDFKNKIFRSITQTDGLLSDHIIDFEVVNEHIWLVFFNGIQIVNMNKLKKNKVKPILELNTLQVNKIEYTLSESGKFNYSQNHIEFKFIAKAYRHRGALTYEYKLEGLNREWHNTTFTNNIIEFSYLPPGDYTFNLKAINENSIPSDTISYSFSISPPIWQTWWFFLIFTIVGGGSIILYFIVRMKRLKHRSNLEKLLKASEITAIKAQMNPHFIFNTLNSVQDLIMLKDKRASSIYLGKFADLMRKTLDASGKDFITLAEEIELLNIYLDLEKLRFGDNFICKVNADIDNKKLQDLHLPAMLLQPYIENAIKHGLLHLNGQKLLNVNFFIEDTFLICEIIDNGVGRKKSAEINQRREKYHASFATDANKKRIDLIKETTSQEISLNIIDLYKNDQPIGTKVVFKFSV